MQQRRRQRPEAMGANAPFAGSIVPSKFWNKDARVRSFMIEVRRDLYMDELSGERLAAFTNCIKHIANLIHSLANEAAANNRPA